MNWFQSIRKKNFVWRTSQHGFTLVELLVALALTAILAVTIAYTFRVQAFTHKTQEQVAALQQNLRAAMFLIESDLRMAGSDPTDTATDSLGNKAGLLSTRNAPPPASGSIVNANDLNSIYFTINRPSSSMIYDGVIGTVGQSEILHYGIGPDSVTGHSTFKVRSSTVNSAGSFQPVAEGIANLQFAYFDKSNAAILLNGNNFIPSSQLNQIRRVRISLSGTTLDGSIAKTLTSDVWLRNMVGR